KLGVRDQIAAASVLFKEKGCTACHTGLGESRPRDVPIKEDAKQCRAATYGEGTPAAFGGYRAVAASEKYPSPFAERQQRLERAGFQGYSCASCHVWNGRLIGSPDPAAIGPDLTRTAGRIRRDWFDRYLENPMRFHPGTPMPGVFPHGKPAMLASVLDGDPAKQ